MAAFDVFVKNNIIRTLGTAENTALKNNNKRRGMMPGRYYGCHLPKCLVEGGWLRSEGKKKPQGEEKRGNLEKIR